MPDDARENMGSLSAEVFGLWAGADTFADFAGRRGGRSVALHDLWIIVGECARTHPFISRLKRQELLRQLISRAADGVHNGIGSAAADRLLFREAIAFLLETELYWHWPVRHAARRFAASLAQARRY